MLQSENIRIEKIQINELEEVAVILTEAFEANPAYSLIFNNKELKEGLFWLFKTNLFLLNRRQSLTRVIKEKDSGKIIGSYTIIPPRGIKKNLPDYFQIGLPRFIMKFGFSTLQKMLGMDSYNKQLLNQSMQTTEYYYLSMVAMREECRGKGIGTFAIRYCLDELSKEEKKSDLLGLTTQLPENVTFYSKLGFEKIDEGEVQYKQDRYYNYNMKFHF